MNFEISDGLGVDLEWLFWELIVLEFINQWVNTLLAKILISTQTVGVIFLLNGV